LVPEPGDITRLLQEWKDGQPEAFQKLLPLVIAYRYLTRERPGHTLQATGLVHELYLRLNNQREANWENREHFFTFTAKVMRMILADHARRNLREKRGGGAEHLPLSDQFPWVNLNGPEYAIWTWRSMNWSRSTGEGANGRTVPCPRLHYPGIGRHPSDFPGYRGTRFEVRPGMAVP
jgi:hypothetical protein